MASRFKLSFLIVLFAQLLAVSVMAWPPTFGMEFNFSNKTLFKAWKERGRQGKSRAPGKEEQLFARKFPEAVKLLCGDECQVMPHEGKHDAEEYSITFLDGWGFNISVDSMAVEIQTLPETSAQVRANVERYRTYVYGAAKLAQLKPESSNPPADMPGHLNVGFLSAFDNDPKAFMRFFLDYADRPSLALVILGSDVSNAPPLRSLPRKQQLALVKIVEEVNSGKLKTALNVTDAINRRVYTSTPHFDDGTLATAQHYQAMGLKAMLRLAKNDLPFEFRAIRNPTDPEEYALLAELIELRLAHVQKQSGDLVFRLREISDFEVSDEGQAATFYQYVSEMTDADGQKVDWQRFEKVVPHSIVKLLKRGYIQKAFSADIDRKDWRQDEIWLNMIDPNRKFPDLKDASLFSRLKNACSRLVKSGGF